jgi:hypothetical protein
MTTAMTATTTTTRQSHSGVQGFDVAVDVDKSHPVICAWCKAEGKTTVVGYSAVPDSHGICKRHLACLMREVA